jgi:prepilin-type processing-associated H-X9-DG protein
MPLLATIVGLGTRREAMDQHSEPSGPGLTKTAVLVIFVVLGVGVALLISALPQGRESARRIQCNNQLKRIGLALHNYTTANKNLFPPGAVCSASNLKADSANLWADAKLTSKGAKGTSWILPLLPYIEGNWRFDSWDFNFGVSAANNKAIASQAVPGLYCPTRRAGFRSPVDAAMMLDPKWTRGGTDYGGCIGRHQGFATDADQSVVLPDTDGMLPLCFVPGYSVPNNTYMVSGDPVGRNNQLGGLCYAKSGFGIFGRVNVSTGMADFRDNQKHTIMTGELQRIIKKVPAGPFTPTSGPILSHDGWAVGGSPTLFTTGCTHPANAETKSLMNNGHFASPGSEHLGGANFGFCDASVRFLTTTIDANIFAILGSIADKVTLL